MSLVHLSSIGQRPQSFHNSFPQGIQLGAGAEVSLVGYSGNLNGEANTTTGEPYEIVIQEGQNDTMTFMHGDTRAASTPAMSYYPPQVVTLEAGVYTPVALATHIEDTLNKAERIANYESNWTCAYNNVTFKLLIKCASDRQVAGVGGEYINYNGSTAGVANGGASSTLTPFPGNISFIDTTPMTCGSSGQTVGTVGATAPVGCYLEFTTIAATEHADVGYTLCMVPPQMASKMEFINAGTDYPEAPALPPPAQPPVTQYQGDTNPELDFAYANQGAETYGFAPHAICIGPDGRIGIKEARTQDVVGAMKDPANCEVNWTATNINIGAPGLKKIGMSFRQAAGAAGSSPLIVCEYLAWVAAAWVSIGTTTISGSIGQNATFRYAQSLFAGVTITEESAGRATSLPITIYRTLNGSGAGALAVDPAEPLVVAWSPLDNLVLPDMNPSTMEESGLITAARNSNKLGESLGFPIGAYGTITPTSVGLESTEALGLGANNGEYSPLLITCRDLPVTGYVGGARGTTAQLLGIGRVRGNEISYGFSAEVGENWIQLRNTEPITLYKLGIDIMTETMTEYTGLEPNFSCWLKFRSNAHHLHLKENSMMGVQNSRF
jgi:hypothetical protein